MSAVGESRHHAGCAERTARDPSRTSGVAEKWVLLGLSSVVVWPHYNADLTRWPAQHHIPTQCLNEPLDTPLVLAEPWLDATKVRGEKNGLAYFW
jgi:hypothetical protein